MISDTDPELTRYIHEVLIPAYVYTASEVNYNYIYFYGGGENKNYI